MIRRAWSALFALTCLIGPALAAPPLVTRSEAPPLAAWIGFCDKRPTECAVDPAEPEVMAVTQESLDVIDAVNRYVNRTVTPITDFDHWRVEDVWDFPVADEGDCEDYQLLKRKLLVDAGMPRRAMRMTVVLNELGEGHAVLTIRTTKDDLILDNRTNAILTWAETGYAFIKRESSAKLGWVFLEPAAPAPVVTAAK
jgi:predicted transglutaminase-like cysteine proteinase